MKRIVELDGLRGVLALWVVFYHMCSSLPLVKQIISNTIPFIMEAWFPVDVFFMMSGFVMMHVYGDQFSTEISAAKFKHFMLARFARLYPVHFLSLVLLLIILLPGLLHSVDFYTTDGRYSIGTFLGSLFLLQGPWILIRTWNYPAWSISAEWHAYILFPILILLVNRFGRWGSIFSIVLLTVMVFILYNSDVGNEKYPTNGLAVILRTIPLFYSGMVLYRLIFENSNNIGLNDWASFFVLIILIIALCGERYSSLAVIFVPFLILISLRCGVISRFFSTKPCLFLGKISYSMYMTHALVQALVLVKLPNLLAKRHILQFPSHVLFSQILFYMLSILLAIFFGWLTCRFVEMPIRKRLIKFFG